MDKEEKVQLGLGVASVVAFVFGFRRVAGAVLSYDAYRAYKHKHNAHAAFSGIVGGSLLVAPSWPDSVNDFVREKISGSPYAPGESPAEIQQRLNKALPPPAPIANYASLTGGSKGADELFMGNWTLYDVSDTQTPEIATRAKTMKPGETAALVLGQPSAPPLVFKARVIPGGQGGRYVGQWVTQKPGGGPEFAEFGPQHVLVVT